MPSCLSFDIVNIKWVAFVVVAVAVDDVISAFFRIHYICRYQYYHRLVRAILLFILFFLVSFNSMKSNESSQRKKQQHQMKIQAEIVRFSMRMPFRLQNDQATHISQEEQHGGNS